MRKLVSFMFALVLCMSLSVPAAAAISNQGGHHHHKGDKPIAPKTGSSTVAMLAITGCAAGGIGVAAYKKSKE